jgi:hypothetical protein
MPARMCGRRDERSCCFSQAAASSRGGGMGTGNRVDLADVAMLNEMSVRCAIVSARVPRSVV